MIKIETFFRLRFLLTENMITYNDFGSAVAERFACVSPIAIETKANEMDERRFRVYVPDISSGWKTNRSPEISIPFIFCNVNKSVDEQGIPNETPLD